MKILFRGGSITAGFGVSLSFVDIIRKRIVASNIEIVNKSLPRETSFNGIWSFTEEIYPEKPDVLILNFGMDDAFHPVYRSEFKENIVQIIRLTRKVCHSEIILLTSHHLRNQYDTEAIMIYNRALREVAQDLQCEFVPIHTYIAGIIIENNIPIDKVLQSDDRYPTEYGHQLYADAILVALRKYL